MLGRFLEVSLATRDIAASVSFYERLGFTQLPSGDAWPYPYCALGDGRLCIGLHQREAPPTSLCFVRPGLLQHAELLAQAGLAASESHLGFEDFHRLQLPAADAQTITLLEARTFSPPADIAAAPCGYWCGWSVPSADFAASAAWWERAGFIAHDLEALPFEHRPLSMDYLNVALHHPAHLSWPALVFSSERMDEIIARLQGRELETQRQLPAGLDPRCNGLVAAPEGTRLLLLQGDYQ
jgi:catechol 2,3-dioxygenase-like lactoylglutathione lyase family enzyme